MSNEMNFNDVVERVKDALAGAATTTGQTFLPTETADEIIQLVYERNFMRSLFPSMPMSRRMMKVPKLTGSVNFHGMSLNTAVSGAGSVQTGVATPESSQTSTVFTTLPQTRVVSVIQATTTYCSSMDYESGRYPQAVQPQSTFRRVVQVRLSH
jgi:hypothetical protein